MVMRAIRKVGYKGLTEVQVRVLTLLASGIGYRSRSAVTRLSGVSEGEYLCYVIGNGVDTCRGFRHSLLSLGFIAEWNNAVAITDGGRQFLAGLSI